jgi:superfamily II DNA or RNA helicase
VDAILPEILASLQQTSNLVIEAPPGAGKTTRVPPAILGLVSGEVIVLEPRRHSSEKWTSDEGPLRARKTTVDFIPPARLLRDEGDVADRSE